MTLAAEVQAGPTSPTRDLPVAWVVWIVVLSLLLGSGALLGSCAPRRPDSAGLPGAPRAVHPAHAVAVSRTTADPIAIASRAPVAVPR